MPTLALPRSVAPFAGAAALLLALVAAQGVASPSRVAAPGAGIDPPAPDARPLPGSVVATTGMVADLAVSVMPPGASVVALMGSGVDPHLYKPTRDDVARLMGADLVVTNGLMLEGRMGEVLSSASKGRPVIRLGDLPGVQQSGLVIRPEGSEGHPDPHIWLDPALWSMAAKSFAEELGARHPDSAGDLRRRARDYADQLAELSVWAQTTVATIPPSQRILITSHDAFRYFGRALGLRVEGIQGISTDSEPGLRRIGELVDLIVTNRVPAVFVESSVPSKSIEALVEGAKAKGHTVVVGGELYSDALGAAGTWEGTVAGMIDHNVTTIVRALGGTAPAGGWKGRLSGGHGSGKGAKGADGGAR